MSGPLGSQQWMYATETQQFYPYTIDNSLRFDGVSYLQRTPSTAGNQDKFTLSMWVKLNEVPNNTILVEAGSGGLSRSSLGFTSSGQLQFLTVGLDGQNYAGPITTRVFRDVCSWYHLCLVYDSSLTTSVDIAKIYCNGVRITDVTQPYDALQQNDTTYINSIQVHRFNSLSYSVSNHTNCYVSEIHLLDGISVGETGGYLDEFGELKQGVWTPKDYTGSYGTNGFHLDFADGTSATTLGYDAAGSNDFTPTGIATSDQMLDSPTNNFATLNPLWPYGVQPTEGNLALTQYNTMSASTFGIPSSGKWYVEARMAGNAMLGLVVNGKPVTYPGNNTEGFGLSPGSIYYNNSATSIDTGGWVNGSTSIYVVGMLFDMTNSKMFFHVAGTWKQYGDPDASGAGYPFPATIDGQDVSVIVRSGYNSTNGGPLYINFGQDSTFSGLTSPGTLYSDSNGFGEFMYPVPTDALALCTQNLPDPAFDPRVGASPQDHFSVDLDADGSGALTAAQAVFPTGIWWLKNRTTTGNSDHLLVDSARGSTLELNPNAASAESTYSDPGGSSVAWSWKAASAVSGTTTGSGTLKSYSGYANATAGVSVITYEGNGTAGHQIPHHLGAAPSVVVVKSQDEGTRNWIVYHANTGASPETEHMVLNGTAAVASSSTAWNNTAPSASVVTLGSYAHVNNDTYNNIMYAFAEKNGFSKFGVYQGNFNADGPFVYLGFRPAFVMIKSTGGTTGKWCIFDAERDGYNPDNDALHVYPTAAEDTTDQLDILSNGFKIRGTGTDVNNSAYEYIYMAFAEQPFKYSLAR